MTPSFPDNVEATEDGRISYSTFIGLWESLLLVDPCHTLYSLLQIGCWREYTGLVRRTSSDLPDRHVLRCCVAGMDGVGKSSLLQYLRMGEMGHKTITAPLHTVMYEVKDKHRDIPNDWRYLLV